MTSVTRLERDTPDLRSANLRRLEQLAAVLASRGLEASLLVPPGRVPRLHVAHPAGDADIYASRCEDGAWWFWWPWAERIGPEADLDATASKIEQQIRKPLAD